jgi:hypothetical protein
MEASSAIQGVLLMWLVTSCFGEDEFSMRSKTLYDRYALIAVVHVVNQFANSEFEMLSITLRHALTR